MNSLQMTLRFDDFKEKWKLGRVENFSARPLFVNNGGRMRYYREFVAEALAEYFISESPREVAMKVGFLMEAEYRKKYGDKWKRNI